MVSLNIFPHENSLTHLVYTTITTLSGCGNRPTNTVTTNDTTKLHDTLTSESAKACSITNLQTDILINKDTIITSLSEIISSPPTSKELDHLSNTITQRLLSLSPHSPLR